MNMWTLHYETTGDHVLKGKEFKDKQEALDYVLEHSLTGDIEALELISPNKDVSMTKKDIKDYYREHVTEVVVNNKMH